MMAALVLALNVPHPSPPVPTMSTKYSPLGTFLPRSARCTLRACSRIVFANALMTWALWSSLVKCRQVRSAAHCACVATPRMMSVSAAESRDSSGIDGGGLAPISRSRVGIEVDMSATITINSQTQKTDRRGKCSHLGKSVNTTFVL